MIQLKENKVKLSTWKSKRPHVFDVENVFQEYIDKDRWIGGYKIPITGKIALSVACGFGTYSDNYSACYANLDGPFVYVEVAFYCRGRGVLSGPERVNAEELLKWLVITKPFQLI